jgi:hypothetical protein
MHAYLSSKPLSLIVIYLNIELYYFLFIFEFYSYKILFVAKFLSQRQVQYFFNIYRVQLFFGIIFNVPRIRLLNTEFDILYK